MPVNRTLCSICVLVCLVASCASPVGKPPSCLTDADCAAAGNVCFADGCGDPTRGIAVEITGGSTVGLFPQDFLIEQLGTTQNFELQGPLAIVGSFQRERSAGVDPTNRSIYLEEVVVRATGESEILPGVARSYQARFAMTDRGTFSMNVGQGNYTVTALPTNLEVPPQTVEAVRVSPDAGSVVNYAFASVEGAVSLSGRLIKKKVVLPQPSELYITQAAMDLQAIDPMTGEPLSQRIETSTGRPGSRGDFILVMSPRAKTLPVIELVASPRSSTSLLPTRRFTMSAPFPSNLTLEIGDFGDPVPDVPLEILGNNGEPLPDALVVLEGRVGAGATFKSRLLTTDNRGMVLAEVLPPDDGYTVTIFPRSFSRSAVTQYKLKLKVVPGEKPSFDPSSIRCGNRIAARGKALLPNGMPAANLTVRAVEVGGGTLPLPLDDVNSLTESDGSYELFLDPGNWRLEFLPVDLPQTSRLITISAAAATSGGTVEGQSFAPITLPSARLLTGVVTATSLRGSVPLQNAELRFFRVTTIEGKPAAVLLGSGITNGVGAYSVILPTRELPKQ